MAVAPVHGQGLRVLLDEKDLSPFLRTINVSGSAETADVTVFDSGCDREFISGLGDATFSFDGLFAASTPGPDDIVEFLDDALGGSTKHVLTVDYERSTGGRTAMLTADNTSYDISTPIDDVVSVAVDAQASSGYAGGVLLLPLTTHTSTDDLNGSGVLTPGTTTAGGTTSGGVAHFHVTDLNSTGDAVLSVQHSTSGSTWVAISGLASTQSGGAGFERLATTGTIKEQTRANVNPSSSLDTITASVAFTRRVRT